MEHQLSSRASSSTVLPYNGPSLHLAVNDTDNKVAEVDVMHDVAIDASATIHTHYDAPFLAPSCDIMYNPDVWHTNSVNGDQYTYFQLPLQQSSYHFNCKTWARRAVGARRDDSGCTVGGVV